MQRVLILLNLLIVIAILAGGLITVRNLLTPVKVNKYRIKEKPVEKSLSEAFPSLNLLLNKNPFGVEEDSPRDTSPDAEKGWTLLGTIYDQHGRGVALFLDPTRQQRLYFTGQEIEGLGRLLSVGLEEAVIQGSRRLVLKRKALEDLLKPPPKVERVKYTPPEVKRVPFVKRSSSGEYIVDRFKVQEAVEHPEQLMTDARLQPAFRDGKQYGFILKEVRPGGIYHNLGLRNNDVLLKINEFDITDPEAALRAFTELKGAEEIKLHLLRNGKKITLRYIIQ